MRKLYSVAGDRTNAEKQFQTGGEQQNFTPCQAIAPISTRSLDAIGKIYA